MAAEIAKDKKKSSVKGWNQMEDGYAFRYEDPTGEHHQLGLRKSCPACCSALLQNTAMHSAHAFNINLQDACARLMAFSSCCLLLPVCGDVLSSFPSTRREAQPDHGEDGAHGRPPAAAVDGAQELQGAPPAGPQRQRLCGHAQRHCRRW